MSRISRDDEKFVIVAIDHGLGLNVLPDLENTEAILKEVVEGGADAVLTTYGIAKNHQKVLSKTGLILRLDGGSSILSDNSNNNLLYSVEDALRIGADAVACMGFPGGINESKTYENLSKVITESQKWDIPVVAEMLPGGFSDQVPNNLENVKLVSRIGSELGADLIKTTYVGPQDKFLEVVKGCMSPVVVLGGNKTNNLKDLFEVIKSAINAGAAGVAIGRNVWKGENPKKMTQALVKLVHDGASVDEAINHIEN